ncbi:MAG: arylsulfatase [bacterium]
MPLSLPIRLGACLGLFLALVAPAPAAPSKRPNIVLILTDDQGWGDLHANGNPVLETPVMDRLVAEGVSFDRFYVDPVCAPTRASLLTGRYALRAGVTGVTRGRETMRSDEVTLAEILRQAGYATGCFGKWHNGAHYPNTPNGQGFDEFLGFCGGHINDYFDPHLVHNGEPVKTKGYVTDVITDAAMAFIRKHRGGPFLVYLPYNAPHKPLQVPDREYDRYRSRGLDEETSAIYGMLAKVDENVGRVLAELDELKLRERTIVVFLSDNGPSTDRWNGDMKGIKANIDEGGTRVPLMIRWSGHLPAGVVVKSIAAHIDLVPTLTELCGVAKPESLRWDGVSLVPQLQGKSDAADRTLFVHMPLEGRVREGPGAVRTPQFRAVWLGTALPCSLFDMVEDPGQKRNVAEANPGVVKRLREAYDAWLADCTSRSIDRPPIPVGYPESPTVSLPVTECFLGKGLRFANELGWAEDWATGWTDPKDRLEWDLDVVRAGRYEVTLLQTAPKEAVGAVLMVSAGPVSCQAKVERSYDPPAEKRGDRNPKSTRLVKSFAEMRLGTLKLEKGRVRVALQAVEPASRRLPDVYSLTLRYLGS